MKIIVDAHGGDNAPLEILKGCREAIDELKVEIVLVGRSQQLNQIMDEHGIKKDGFSFHDASEVIEADDHAVSVRNKRDSSMAVGFRLLKDGGGDAFVSAGNSGAMLMGATLIVGRIKNVLRAAFAPVMITETGLSMLIDCGANVEVKPEYLLQFAIMGSQYMQRIMHIPTPRVGLINVGTEETKGTQLYIDSFHLLKNYDQINFVGNIEGRDVFTGAVDVIVCDGFTGNIILKVIEGLGITFIKMIKNMFMKNMISKLGALCLKSGLQDFKKRMDYTEYGGAVVIGIKKPVIKAHGSSNAKAFKSAIRQAKNAVDEKVTEAITKSFENITLNEND